MTPSIPTEATVFGTLVAQFAPKTKGNHGELSQREVEVLRLVAAGQTAKAIGTALGISWQTVRKHKENIREKLDLRSTSALTRYAIEHKL